MRPHGGPAAAAGLLVLALAGPPAARVAGAEGARGTGSIAGQVTLGGPPPVVAAVQVGKHRWFCGKARTPASLRLGPGGALAGALVILEGEGLPAAAGPPRAHLDNRDCEFAPRVQVTSVGSELEVLTSDPVLHTAHAYLDGRETLFHVALPVFLSRRVVRLERPGLVTIECDAGHTWMRAFIWVTATGFATVTDPAGRFRLAGIPPGRYRVRVRHEVLGERALPVEAAAGHEARVVVRYGREP